MKKILVVDDHPIVTGKIRDLLIANGYDAVTAHTPAEAKLLVAHAGRFDAAIVDLSLSTPGGDIADGLEMIEEFRTDGFTGKTIIYTMHDEAWHMRRLSEAHPDAVVFKTESPTKLVAAVNELTSGHKFHSVEFEARIKSIQGNSAMLTEKDIEVAQLVASGMTNNSIASRMNMSEKTVEYHRSNIIRKLGTRTMPQAIMRAMTLGIISMFMMLLSLPIHALTAESGPLEVDMGTSVIWADRNLGADSPAEGGDCYSAAETFVKSEYSWSTYTLCNGTWDSCHDIGVSDIAGTKYDAAHANLGNGWYTPAPEDFEELLEKCTIELVDVDGLKCARFTATNGNTLLLPLCGHYQGWSTRIRINQEAAYQTSEVDYKEEFVPGYNVTASVLAPTFCAVTLQGIYPSLLGTAFIGMSVRPVRKRPAAIDSVIADDASTSSPRTIYDLNGRLVSIPTSQLPAGIYIVHEGTRRYKLLIR